MSQIEVLRDENTQLRNREPTTRSRSPDSVKPNLPKVDRPAIESNLSERDWALFMDSWERYKHMTRVREGADTIMELRACCSHEVNQFLFEYIGPSKLKEATTEVTMLEHIKSVVVKEVHEEVHRMSFFRLQQGDNEPIQRYVARLKAQAAQCKFTVANPLAQETPISYAEEMIPHQLISGLQNTEFQTRILSEAATLKTLKSKIDHLELLESSQNASSSLHLGPAKPNAEDGSQAAANKQSAYKKSVKKKQTTKTATPNTKRCNGCGKTKHREGEKFLQRSECPAYNTTYHNCGIKCHAKSICWRSQLGAKPANMDESDDEPEEERTIASATHAF